MADVKNDTREYLGRIKKISADFCSYTSAHGFPHITRTNNAPLKLFWICIVLVVFAGSTLHLYYLVELYLEYSYYTSASNDAIVPLQVRLHFYPAFKEQWPSLINVAGLIPLNSQEP